MGTKPVRVPEDSYERLRQTAIELDKPLSETVRIVLEAGFQNLDTGDYIELDPDLNREFQETVPFDSEREALAKLNELQQRQRERNRERSELDAGTP